MSGLVLYHIYLLCILRLCSIMCILSTIHHTAPENVTPHRSTHAAYRQPLPGSLLSTIIFFLFFFFFAADCCFDPSLILCYARVWIQLHSYFLSSLDGLQVGFLSKQSRNARVILRETNKSSIAASPSVSLLHTAYTRFSWVFYLV